jgi:hypothetical protein
MVSHKGFTLPDCGLFRTTRPLPGHEVEVPASLLVYFHNHSESGLPEVLPPARQRHNRWSFPGPGVEVRQLIWVTTLERLPPQGFYALRQELTFDGGSWPAFTLVQLGYTRQAGPVLFLAQERAQLAENDLFFAEHGVPITPGDLALLEPLTVYREGRPSHTDGP